MFPLIVVVALGGLGCTRNEASYASSAKPHHDEQVVSVVVEARDRWGSLRPLSGAIVSVGDLKDETTDEQGAMFSLAPGTYTYSVILPGAEYQTYGKLCVPQGSKTVGLVVNYNRRANEAVDLCKPD